MIREPEPDQTRVGVLMNGPELWGYLLIRPEVIRWRRGRRFVEEPAIVEEIYRLAVPKADDVDWADQPGWSDTIVTGDALDAELTRLETGDMLLTGRTLSINWVEGTDAIEIRERYFSG